MVVSHPDTVGLSDVTLKHSPHYDRGLTQAYLRVKCLKPSCKSYRKISHKTCQSFKVQLHFGVYILNIYHGKYKGVHIHFG